MIFNYFDTYLILFILSSIRFKYIFKHLSKPEINTLNKEIQLVLKYESKLKSSISSIELEFKKFPILFPSKLEKL